MPSLNRGGLFLRKETKESREDSDWELKIELSKAFERAHQKLIKNFGEKDVDMVVKAKEQLRISTIEFLTELFTDKYKGSFDKVQALRDIELGVEQVEDSFQDLKSNPQNLERTKEYMFKLFVVGTFIELYRHKFKLNPLEELGSSGGIF